MRFTSKSPIVNTASEPLSVRAMLKSYRPSVISVSVEDNAMVQIPLVGSLRVIPLLTVLLINDVTGCPLARTIKEILQPVISCDVTVSVIETVSPR